MAMRWRDDGFRYGALTRLLHWGTVLLLAWQFTGMGVKLIVGKAPITAFWVGTHKSVGTVLLLVILIRALWGLYNMKTRPAHGGGFWGLAAKAGHLVLYVLMLIVPALALLRQYGSGKPMEFFGLPFIQGGGAETSWMTAPANAAHGLLAWVLLAAIGGHVLMVLVHRYVWKDDTTRRMMG
ncbi:cytochrome b561 [Brevundimonas faecalis]|uniref:Cytochrome b561 n=2 Tax=Brevundimonas faecalis TaxID=947378 RepID=A0ABV2RDH6_9CAUL